MSETSMIRGTHTFEEFVMVSKFSSKARSIRLRRELREDNSRLHELGSAIDELTCDSRIAANHWNELQDLFNDLRDQLSLHFALEEAEGYLNISSDGNPELICSAEYLKLQHVELFEDMRIVAEAACDVPSDHTRRIEAVLGRYRQFRWAFEAHEEAEWNLMQRACDEDLGVGD